MAMRSPFCWIPAESLSSPANCDDAERVAATAASPPHLTASGLAMALMLLERVFERHGRERDRWNQRSWRRVNAAREIL
jgi:hypothetical protein